MRRRFVEGGEVVVGQGGRGDCLYIIESGDYDVFVRGDSADDTERGHLVHTYRTGGWVS